MGTLFICLSATALSSVDIRKSLKKPQRYASSCILLIKSKLPDSKQPGMTEELRARMGDAAVNAAKAVGYVGAGTY